MPRSSEKFTWPDITGGDLGSRAKLTPGSHLWWYPTEVNTTMLGGNQWFWARNKHPRTVTQLVDIFYTSVGRNGNLILNLSPDKRGLVPDNQLYALNRTADILNQTFATDLAVDSEMNVYVAGRTDDSTFPSTPGAFQPTCPIDSCSSGTFSGFLTKINAAGSALVYSTFLGGEGASYITGVAVDSAFEAYVTGYTQVICPSPGDTGSCFPTTGGALQSGGQS